MRDFFIGMFLVVLLFDTVVLYISVTRKDREKTRNFTFLVIGLLVYVLGYILEIAAITLDGEIIAVKLENLGIPMIGPFFFLFVVDICREKWKREWMTLAGLVYSQIFFYIVFFNDFHRLYYPEINFGEISILLSHGPLYYVQQACTMLCIFAAYVVIVKNFVKGNVKLRKQYLMIGVAALVPTVTNVLNIVKFFPAGFDPTPIGVTICLVFFVIILFYYKMFDIIPIATEMAIMNIDDGVVVLDKDWGFYFANQSAKVMFPQLDDCQEMSPIAEINNWPSELKHIANTGSFNFKMAHPSDADTQRHYRAEVSHVSNTGSSSGSSQLGWSVIIRDITDSTELLKRMEELAITDSLTGLFNRRHFITALKREIEMAKRGQIDLAIVMCDIDFFKKINDKYGHIAGDHVLRSVASTLNAQLRPYDIVARYGGEEFIVLVKGIQEKNLQAFVDRLCNLVGRTTTNYQGATITATISLGATALLPDDEIDETIAMADKAMYEAKNAGRNCAVVHYRSK